MTAASPAADTGELVAMSLGVGGSVLDTDHLVSFEIWHGANRIPRARVTLNDGQPDDGKFPLSEGDKLIPGVTITLGAGYAGQSTTLFTGVIVGQSIAIAPGAPARLVLDCADILLKMTLSRSSVISEQTSDADLISALVSASGGSVGKNSAGTAPHASFVQAHASDWDVMLMRAEANGCVAIVDAGKVDIVLPSDAAATPVLKLDYGDAIVSLDLAIEATDQLTGSAITTDAWDYSTQALATATPGSASVTVPGNLTSSTLAKVFGVSTAAQRTGASMPEALLTDWATGALIRRELSQVRGSVQFQGSALVKPGTLVALGNVGERFNGNAWVGAVRHHVGDGDWQTTVEIGLPPQGFAAREPSVADAEAGGLLPPLRGLQTGKVVKIDSDPDGQFRVQVKLPLFDADNPIWARLASFYASSGFGALFVPEIDDEVLLGFMNEDPTNPVILGSVYSSGRKPTYPPDDKNTTKAIVTKSKMELNFNDPDVVLKISTPGGRIVTLDDKTGTVSIVDPNKNKITMTSSSVDIESAAALNMSSKGAMTISAGAGLTITAKAACDISGMTVSATGKTDLKLASNAMGSLKTAAILEINGALVKIN